MPTQTADIIALILAVVVALVVVGTTAAVLFQQLVHPGAADPGATVEFISRIISVLVAALVGFMAGRRVNGVH